jgi:hypothetical protein
MNLLSPSWVILSLSSAGLVLAEPDKPLNINAQNELIPLRLKELQRNDRLPKGTGEKAEMTRFSAGQGLPDDDAGEAWPGERFSVRAEAHLKRLLAAKDAQVAAGILAGGFRCSNLETGRQKKRNESPFSVEQGEGGEVVPMSAEALLAKIRSLGKIKFKTLSYNQLTTILHVEADREGSEYSATWKCLWEEDGEDLKLCRLEVAKFETVSSRGPWFIDGTQTVIGQNARFEAQVMRGIEFWSKRISRIGDLAMTGHHGIAVGDVNGDGLEDLYVCDGGSLPNQLYLQQPDGTALEVAAQWGVAWLEDSRSALLVDLDNDGDQDLVVATIAMITFAENMGKGGFELRGGFPGAPYPFSLSAADFDSDGDLDLYTCVYSANDDSLTGKRGFESGSPVPFNDAENGGRNVLLANLGGFRFGDVTAEVGLDQKNTRWSFAAAWEDLDRDGDPDLYVANDFGRNCLYINENSRFKEVAAEAGVEDMGAGMSVAWGDFNRDGAADLQIGNMFSAAGRRVGFQQDFGEGKKRMARGNSLFAGSGDSFREVSEEAGIVIGGWAWSSAFADLDNDGWQDLVVANGYLSNTRDDDL